MKVLAAIVICIQLAVVHGQDPTTTTTTPATTTTTKPKTTTTGKTTTTKTTKPTTTKTTTTKKPTTPKPPNCAGTNYEKIGKCCSDPPKAVLSITDKKDKTCGISNTNIKVFTEFSLNKQQSTSKGWNNSLPLNDTSVGKSLYPLAYFADCWFRAKGVMNNETGWINGEALVAFITAGQNEYWTTVLGNAAPMCFIEVFGMSPPLFLKDKKTNVSSTAFLVAQCLAFVAIDNCETKLNTTSCNKDYAMFNNCKDYLFPNVANPQSSPLKAGEVKSFSRVKRAVKFNARSGRKP
ncbi:Hypothetical predicted protein [Cloeon dipterum]|uniref:C-type lectin domain-containing protein n=1 Tax=Cloeon dipterum TaxID=197152 RepID=A0A8S1CJZ0_9INSE|nr:Hypothetical predicted protein [Cloeon dipterum]